MNRVHGEAVKGRVVLYESNVKFVDIRIGRVLVSAREPEGVGWAPGDGIFNCIRRRRVQKNVTIKTYLPSLST